MKTYFKGFQLEGRIRTQPWTTADHDENEKYYDFRTHPELIPGVLEDYKPWDHYEAIQRFYELVKWVNSDSSRFESNDCAFKGPSENEQKEKFQKELVCSGRFMFFFRTLDLNLSVESREFSVKLRQKLNQQITPDYSANLFFKWLVNRSMELIDQLHQESIWNCIAPEIYPVYYSEATINDADKLGHQISYQFWAWGDEEQETMNNLGVLVDTMSQCLRIMSDEIPEAIRDIRLRHS